jgi:antirestriction protein ArdC
MRCARKPTSVKRPKWQLLSGQPYKGINVLMLWGEALAKGFACPFWMTYRQVSELGGQVRKGEHGSLVVYADRIRMTETADNGEEIEHEIPFMKGYTVFNCEQIERLSEHFYARPSPPLPAFERIAGAERFAAATGADIRHGGNRAFYAIEPDYVQLPPFESFTDAESYYSTKFHELTHNADIGITVTGLGIPHAWRGISAASAGAMRVTRPRSSYGAGAAFLCADLGITPGVRDDHASYIASWRC